MSNRDLLVIDLDRCWGCRACEVACKQELELGAGPRPVLVVEAGPRKIDGKLHKDYIPTFCQHCDKPLCMEACPAGAIYHSAEGSVQIDPNVCNGCALCAEACPYGVVEVSAGGRAIKCDLCLSRRREGRLPSCAQHCPGRVFRLLPEDLLSEAVGEKYFWTAGRVVYISGKYPDLGKAL